jgi:hypothetical protein
MSSINFFQSQQSRLILPRLLVEIMSDDTEQSKLIFGSPHVERKMYFASRIFIKLLLDSEFFLIKLGYQPLFYSRMRPRKEVINIDSKDY